MNLDILDAFALLREHGIRVAPSRFVASPEAAVAFAGRRPIALHAVADGRADQPLVSATGSERAVRYAYARVVQRARDTTYVFAQRIVGPGTELSIDCFHDGAHGATVELGCADHRVRGAIPLDAGGARAMLKTLRALGIALTDKAARTLSHALTRAVAVYALDGVACIHLDLRVHGGGYHVVDASIDARQGPSPASRPRFTAPAREARLHSQVA